MPSSSSFVISVCLSNSACATRTSASACNKDQRSTCGPSFPFPHLHYTTHHTIIDLSFPKARPSQFLIRVGASEEGRDDVSLKSLLSSSPSLPLTSLFPFLLLRSLYPPPSPSSNTPTRYNSRHGGPEQQSQHILSQYLTPSTSKHRNPTYSGILEATVASLP